MAKTTPLIVHPVTALDPRSTQALHVQVYERLRMAVLSGLLKGGARLPSTRALANELRVSRTPVLAAYEQLAAEGYVESRVGAGTRVVAEMPEHLLNAGPAGVTAHVRQARDEKRAIAARGNVMAREKFGPELRIGQRSWRTAFRVAVPALEEFPFEIWSRLVSRHLRRPRQEILDYHGAAGLERLRRAIAAHLSVSRGIRCSSDQILIVAGAQSGIDLSARVLLDPGDTALVENPGHLGIYGALRGAGVKIASVAIDREGFAISGRSNFGRNARVAFVTPSNQFPLAVTMSLPRRLALLDWAQSNGAWIVEDDYDSEFRFSGRPIEALRALDRGDRVLYIGSFSKVLYPGLRLGYMVVPADLVDAFAAARRFIDVHPPLLPQAALTDFIEEGHFGRHLRRMRMIYAERAQALSEAFDRHLSGALSIAQPQAGMHTVAWITGKLSDRSVSEAAAREGVEARPLSVYSLGRSKPGLVLGFGNVMPREITEGARKLARALDRIRHH
ncbi:MocR-like pyridoxine biosynthesis transcription factor PdxR [Dongia deserti]|uniref:MocR-like pyridoxine biosynthesis transcription factor PdxR n=1 Tax=Dongia deserti TaxID=2268030 RepID=UPI000E64E25E|nr:PLP-dependent aminotransferase family protein [Dongia deserti]